MNQLHNNQLFGCVPDDPGQTKVIFVQGVFKKKLLLYFFGKSSHTAIIPLKDRKTVNDLTTISLPEVVTEV